MHPRSTNQIEATNPPSEKSRLEGAKIPSLIWPPWCQFSWPNCWPRKGQGKRRSVNLQKDCAIPDSHRWWNQKKTINQVQVIVLNPLIRKINQVFLICISDEIGRRSTSQVIKWLFLQVLTKRSETNVDSIIVSTTKPSFQDLREPWVGTWSALVSPPAASPTWSTRGLPAPSRQPAGPGRAMAPTCNTNLRHPAALRSRSHIPDGQSEMLRLLCPIARAHDPVRPCTRHPECCWLAGEYLLPQFQPRARNAVRGSSLRPAASTQATWQPRCCPPSCSSSTPPTTQLHPFRKREKALFLILYMFLPSQYLKKVQRVKS